MSMHIRHGVATEIDEQTLLDMAIRDKRDRATSGPLTGVAQELLLCDRRDLLAVVRRLQEVGVAPPDYTPDPPWELLDSKVKCSLEGWACEPGSPVRAAMNDCLPTSDSLKQQCAECRASVAMALELETDENDVD